MRYKLYLIDNFTKSTVASKLCYTKQYCHILIEDNGQELLCLPENKRLLVMKSLVTLSKFLGCYDKWEDLKRRHQLKWSNNDGIHFFSKILDSQHNYSAMVKWLKDAVSVMPKSDGNILLYCTLTGLRPTEACQSISLIQNDNANYLNSDSMILEHFKYPEMFIRRTKQAYISIVNDSIIDVAKQSTLRSYNSLRLAIRRNHLIMHMVYCRKIFATYLRSNGIESEIIDLLQGRAPKTVFSRYYFRPDFDHNRIRNCISSLYDHIV